MTRTSNKVESFHAFSAYLDFGSEGISTTNNSVEQEDRIISNQLVCNAVMLQNVADQTRVLNSLQDGDKTFAQDDLSFLSPYGTRHLKQFGEYRAEYQAEARPDTRMTMMPGAST